VTSGPSTAAAGTRASSDDSAADALANANAALTAEIAELKLDLWTARDAAMGAVANAGTLRARNAELEAHIHALRVEIDRLAHVEKSITFRLGNSVVKPLKAARRLVR
jgi:hypothetical protein